jgi:hypothetical protein
MRDRLCRSAVIFLVAGLAGCAGTPAYDPSLTPAENELRQANARFDTTTGAGCAIGAGAGAVLGAVGSLAAGARGGTVVAATAGGGAVGAAVGCGAGYLVARNNQARSDTQAVTDDQVQQAQQDVAAYRRAAAASSQVAQDARERVAMLDQQYQQQSLTATNYQKNLANYRNSASMMTGQILHMQQESDALRQDAASQAPGKAAAMNNAAAQIDAARAQTQRALEDLNATLATVPAGV